MKRLTRYAVALVAVAGSTGLVLLTTGWGSAVASNISGVLVTNTASNPLPVNGTVTIGGAPTVHLASDSTVSVGNTPSVNLAPGGNTVSVGNSPLVRIDPSSNVVEVAPVVQLTESSIQGDVTMSGTGQESFDFQVPAGEVFVIQHVSVLMALPPGQNGLVEADLGDVPVQPQQAPDVAEHFPLERQSGEFGGHDVFVADEDVTLFAGEGENDIVFLRDVDAGDATARITLTGYYAPTPTP
jgi:hypothetical protein